MFMAHSMVLPHATIMSQKQQFLSQNYMLLKHIHIILNLPVQWKRTGLWKAGISPMFSVVIKSKKCV
jgi:hypothetical protein